MEQARVNHIEFRKRGCGQMEMTGEGQKSRRNRMTALSVGWIERGDELNVFEGGPCEIGVEEALIRDQLLQKNNQWDSVKFIRLRKIETIAVENQPFTVFWTQ